MRLIYLPLAIALLVFSNTASFAKTYECKAADEISKLGISSRSTVAVSADEDEQICKFSVNGAKVSSPPQELIAQAFDTLIRREALFSDQSNPDLLAALILSAGPDTDIQDMSDIVQGASSEISSCIRNLLEVQATAIDFGSFDAQGLCVVTVNEPVEFGSVLFHFDEINPIPTMLLFIQRGSLTNLLAIPHPR